MGRPIQKKWFGLPVGSGTGHITVSGVKFADGTTATNAYILKQTGSNAYLVQDAAQTHAAEIVFMVNAISTSALGAGECFILATPFGGSPVPCSKIAQFRLDVYENSTVNSYSWSTIPAVAGGQADLMVFALSLVSAPVASGTVAAGNTLSVTSGTWSGTAPITYAYQWYGNASNSTTGATLVAGATSNTYVVPSSGAYAYYYAVVTATNSKGSSTATSNII